MTSLTQTKPSALKEWLQLAGSAKTQENWSLRWQAFTQWLNQQGSYQGSPVEIADQIHSDYLDSLESGRTALFVHQHSKVVQGYFMALKRGDIQTKTGTVYSPNSRHHKTSSVLSFYRHQCQRLQVQLSNPATVIQRYRLTIADLRAMYAIADPEDKAILALGVSLGWRAGDFIQLQQGFIQELLSAPSQDGFRYFRHLTNKEQVTAYCVLSPCAAQALQHYLTWKAQYMKTLEQQIPESKGAIKAMYLKRLTRLQQDLWTISSSKQLNRRLKQLFQKATLQAGRKQVSWHCLRGYVMTSLNRELGLAAAQKLVGKTVKEAAYLHLEQEIEDRYPAIYQDCFNLDLATVEAEHTRELLSVAQTELKADLYDRQQTEQQLSAQIQNLQQQLLNLEANYTELVSIIKLTSTHPKGKQFLQVLQQQLLKE
jgi:integrase